MGGLKIDEWKPPEVHQTAVEAVQEATFEGVTDRVSKTRDLYRLSGITSRSVISLAHISPDRQRALFNKLQEYYDRFKNGHNTNKCEQYEPFDALPSVMHSSYKTVALHMLLLTGELDADRFAYTQMELEPYYASVLGSAVDTIDDYVRSGGQDVFGGTGLSY